MAEHNFEIEPFFAYGLQGHRPSNIAALRDEVRRTSFFMHTCGENVATTYERAEASLSTTGLFDQSVPADEGDSRRLDDRHLHRRSMLGQRWGHLRERDSLVQQKAE